MPCHQHAAAGRLLGGCLGPTAGPGSIGSPAPEIEGTDSQGQAFKLSDYHGKVVLLDFWKSS